jgi:hypothetical protein
MMGFLFVKDATEPYDDVHRPSAWQNFRYDVYDWIHDHAAGLLIIVLVAIIIGSHQL